MDKPRKSSYPQIAQIFADKTTTKTGWATHLPGDATISRKPMKICGHLRNLRIELRFLG
jgi:hypothetical protein